ncbi:MAG TPA: macro domain-containing protein [Longimicrobiales bacterium]|nr:macro domain-containing protein [Longimicrobiales bacterium]
MVRGDLARAEAECVLRPVRADGAAVTAASRRVEAGAGARVADRVAAQGDSPVGTAFITPAGELSTAFLVHVVVQSVDEPVSTLSVQRGLLNALRRAADFGIASMALPPLGGGAGSLDAEEKARVVVEVLLNHVAEGQPPLEFQIVVESEYEESVFRSLVSAAPRE